MKKLMIIIVMIMIGIVGLVVDGFVVEINLLVLVMI